jgi:hypothetical protein
VPKNYFSGGCHKQVARSVLSAVDPLEELGGSIVDFDFPYIRR